EYEGNDIRLIMQQPVDALITGFDTVRTQREGYYVDTRDASGHTLSRVPARGAFPGSVEVFPEHPGEPITRMEVERPPGALTVMFPAPQNADHGRVVQVTGARPDATLPNSRATSEPPGAPQERELARFPLRLSR